MSIFEGKTLLIGGGVWSLKEGQKLTKLGERIDLYELQFEQAGVLDLDPVAAELKIPYEKHEADLDPANMVIRDLFDARWVCEEHRAMIEKEGYTFAGWFATPQMSHKFDFSKEIEGDTDLFAGFVSYVEDTRTFAIVGSGTSPVLLESNWGNNIGEAQTMTKEDVDGANVYTITLDLEEGDEFRQGSITYRYIFSALCVIGFAEIK